MSVLGDVRTRLRLPRVSQKQLVSLLICKLREGEWLSEDPALQGWTL